ncbi:hypothetical protein D3C87_1143220 [compost metagenome]|uniref:helix-turn-helix domain-containing protein n=1 Tax=Pedobacter sp. ok626 TaxID=1761882 RepID=UPI00088FBB41|nr:helix-turn-helix domain-containing protein [Pedobacter sp. ok626]SDJ49457.1 hypothetical protein SAMN04487898_10381 [Pedobacter sp. ok626]
MTIILKRIEFMLQTYFEEQRAARLQMYEAANKEKWLDSQTVKLMLRKGDRTLFNYVQSGKLISKKIGGANFYLQSSVMNFLERTNA